MGSTSIRSSITTLVQDEPPPRSLFPILLGIPHNHLCRIRPHICSINPELCTKYGECCPHHGPTGRGATLPRLHTHNGSLAYEMDPHRYNSLHHGPYLRTDKYRDGDVIWSDRHGVVVLIERISPEIDYRYYICVNTESVILAWVKIPRAATIAGETTGPRSWSVLVPQPLSKSQMPTATFQPQEQHTAYRVKGQ